VQFHQLPHDFAGKGVLNVLWKVIFVTNTNYQSDICSFRAITLSPLHLVVNYPIQFLPFILAALLLWHNFKCLSLCLPVL